MICENHPDRVAATRCLNCNNPLCDQCAIFMEDGSIMCDRCSLLAILQQKHKTSRDKLVARKEKRSIQEARKRRWAHIQKYIPLVLVFVLSSLILIFFQRGYLPINQEVALSEHPDALFIIIDEAIQAYSGDHEGLVPDRLVDLLGKYLPSKKVRKINLRKFSYAKNSPHSYKLIMKQALNNPVSDMIITENGFELKGDE